MADKTVMTTRINKELHKKIKIKLAKEELTFTELNINLLERWVKGEIEFKLVDKN